MTRSRAFVGALALCCITSPSFACVPFMYVSSVAQARVKTSAGQWVPISIETDASLLRVEYPAPRSATGRFAIIGNIDEEWGYRFPVGNAAQKIRAQRVPLQHLFDEAGIPTWFLGQYAEQDAPQKTLRGMKCRLSLSLSSSDWPLRGQKNSSVCVHDAVVERFKAGFPIAGYGPDGNLVFEVLSLQQRRVPLSRFNLEQTAGRPIIVAGKSPSACGG